MRKLKATFLKMLRRQRGFTLIELLVVVAILGVLAAVAIPNIAKFMGEGREEAATTELANVQTAMIAGMVDADVVEVVAGTFGPGPGNDFTISGSYVLSAYILGGMPNVAGTYSIDEDGAVEQTDYPGLPEPAP